jgi:hypothetical protein
MRAFLKDAVLWTAVVGCFFAFGILGSIRDGFRPSGGYGGMILAALLMSVLGGIGAASYKRDRRPPWK